MLQMAAEARVRLMKGWGNYISQPFQIICSELITDQSWELEFYCGCKFPSGIDIVIQP